MEFIVFSFIRVMWTCFASSFGRKKIYKCSLFNEYLKAFRRKASRSINTFHCVTFRLNTTQQKNRNVFTITFLLSSPTFCSPLIVVIYIIRSINWNLSSSVICSLIKVTSPPGSRVIDDRTNRGRLGMLTDGPRADVGPH